MAKCFLYCEVPFVLESIKYFSFKLPNSKSQFYIKEKGGEKSETFQTNLNSHNSNNTLITDKSHIFDVTNY